MQGCICLCRCFGRVSAAGRGEPVPSVGAHSGVIGPVEGDFCRCRLRCGSGGIVFYKMEERQFFRKPAAVLSGGFGQFKGAGTVFVRPLGTVFSAFSGQSLSAPSVCHRHSFHGRLVSRVLCARRRRDHLSVTAVADSLSATSEDSDGQPRVSSLLTAVLLPIGFTLTDFVSEAPVGSYPAFSPLHFCRCFLLHFP